MLMGGPLIHKPPPFKDLNIRIPIMIPIKSRGLINQKSTLAVAVAWLRMNRGAEGAIKCVRHEHNLLLQESGPSLG